MKNLTKNERTTEVVAARLRELRARAGLSRQALSELTGIHVGTLRVWELGECKQPVNGMVTLARYYNVSLDWLAGLSR